MFEKSAKGQLEWPTASAVGKTNATMDGRSITGCLFHGHKKEVSYPTSSSSTLLDGVRFEHSCDESYPVRVVAVIRRPPLSCWSGYSSLFINQRQNRLARTFGGQI